MKKALLYVVFASEKRKNVLLLLQDGPQEMGYLLRSLDTTRQALLPQMRVLEEHYLVTNDKDIYELTNVGKLITEKMSHPLKMTDVLDVDVEYLGTHKLDFIPSHLLKRLDKLGPCNLITIALHEIFERISSSLKKPKCRGPCSR